MLVNEQLRQRVLLAAILEQSELIFELIAEGQVNTAMQVSVWRDSLLERVDFGDSDTESGD